MSIVFIILQILKRIKVFKRLHINTQYAIMDADINITAEY